MEKVVVLLTVSIFALGWTGLARADCVNLSINVTGAGSESQTSDFYRAEGFIYYACPSHVSGTWTVYQNGEPYISGSIDYRQPSEPPISLGTLKGGYNTEWTLEVELAGPGNWELVSTQLTTNNIFGCCTGPDQCDIPD